ncbi:DUF4231 domain-containing protein [Marinobacter sp. ELB17]|uniref:DUF4231 domain-containing protein n=1 Tax=Marinobacter sp. ELB17 TaxID=270374 RepID=UPI0000F39A3D|nr:DUF4231 domain-containing protein [Marinobacter sp. ELB17]EAZ97557.1 hypothetical protein MELB17_05499 [Marinobacter sp. ELB17]
MNKDEYIEFRLDHQIGWYDKNSSSAQFKYKYFRRFEIISAAAIPLIAGFGTGIVPVNLILGILGAAIAVASSFEALSKYHEQWIEYRTTCESLKHEKFLFLSGAEPYCEENSYRLLVQRVESLISKENSEWFRYTKKPSTKSNDDLESKK